MIAYFYEVPVQIHHSNPLQISKKPPTFSETLIKRDADFVLRLAIEMHLLGLDWP